MRLFSYLHYPYFPNRQNKKVSGRPTPYKYMHRIAYTETVRGVNDEYPALLFYGAPFELVKDACNNLFRQLQGNLGNLLISNEHSCRVRNGKCYWRVVVLVVNLNEQFLSFETFTQLLLSHMKRISNCTIRHYRTGTFLNL